MNKNRFYDEMDIQAVESKLSDVTVTAIPIGSKSLSNVNAKSYHHQNPKTSSQHYSTSSKSSKSQQQQYLNYEQQNRLIQSAIQLVQQQQLQQQQQQQLQQQRQQLLENGVSIANVGSHSSSSSAAAAASHSYGNYGGQSNNASINQLASVLPQTQSTASVSAMSSQNAGLSKYAQLLAVIEEMGRDIRPTYAMGRGDRLKRLIIQAKVLVRECLMETERSARQ